MSRRSMIFSIVVSALLIPALVRAQDQNQQDRGGDNANRQDRGGQGMGRGNFDPATFRQQMLDRMREQLGANEDEWKVLSPKIEKVFTAQRESRGGMGGFGFGGGGRGRNRGGDGGTRGAGGGGDNQQPSAVQAATEDLRNTLDNKNASADDISAKLKTLREARDKARGELQTAQKELKEVLTQRQEATLVSMGMLE